jgi:hypothetical protein
MVFCKLPRCQRLLSGLDCSPTSLFTNTQYFPCRLPRSGSHDQHFEGELPRKKAASDCYLIEQIWKLQTEIDDLHLLMDPDDFLRLKNQLCLKSLSETALFCFRSRGLVEITKQCTVGLAPVGIFFGFF